MCDWLINIRDSTEHRQKDIFLFCFQYFFKIVLHAGEGVEKREPSYTVGGNAN